MDDARILIDRLGLAPHPEGGWYRETWRAPTKGGTRGEGTSILYLLETGQRSHWHRIDAAELWLFQAGTALALSTADASGRSPTTRRLGVNVLAGEQPQHLVPAGQWQAAAADAGWCLVACVVVPAFRFEGFELAPPDWSPEAA